MQLPDLMVLVLLQHRHILPALPIPQHFQRRVPSPLLFLYAAPAPVEAVCPLRPEAVSVRAVACTLAPRALGL